VHNRFSFEGGPRVSALGAAFRSCLAGPEVKEARYASLDFISIYPAPFSPRVVRGTSAHQLRPCSKVIEPVAIHTICASRQKGQPRRLPKLQFTLENRSLLAGWPGIGEERAVVREPAADADGA
jgi:hypothetical protein